MSVADTARSKLHWLGFRAIGLLSRMRGGAWRVCSLPGQTSLEPPPGPALLHSVEQAPNEIGDGWSVSTLAAEGVDAVSIGELLTAVEAGDYPKLDGLLVARRGKLVLEAYFNGFHRDAKHDTRSAFKSVTSALLGIAWDQGRIAGLDEPLSAHFPDYWPAVEVDPERKSRITLAHLLTMTAGFDAEENWGLGPFRENDMWRSRDWFRYSLDMPMATEPGERFSYNSSSSFLLGGVVSRAAGMPLIDFARANLFEPLGIRDYCWTLAPGGHLVAQGSFFIRPRDMLKIGQMFLGGGLWNGRRILSEEWIAESTRRHVGSADPRKDTPDARREGYGYQWWTYEAADPRCSRYFASGNGGQKIIVLPALDAVVVFTGSNYNQGIGHAQIGRILEQVLLPAMLD